MRQTGSNLPSFMKKAKNDLPRRYKAVYDKLYSELPIWKRQLVDEKHDRQCTELAKQVIREAEKKD
jgi:hypothetical protein